MNLLLLSNSRSPDAPYLSHAVSAIAETAGMAKRVFFVPFAGVTINWDDYTQKVRAALSPLGLEIEAAHEGARLEDADVVMVGGGNSFHLLRECRDRGLLKPMSRRVRDGAPYIGWSAGANLACPTIRTTNDMPIVETGGFDALGLIDFQINPHFTNALPAGHQGETREERLAEFLAVNPKAQVLGLPEGDWVRVNGGALTLVGPKPALWLRAGQPPMSLTAGPLPPEFTVRRE
jgi:dipeptidase E